MPIEMGTFTKITFLDSTYIEALSLICVWVMRRTPVYMHVCDITNLICILAIITGAIPIITYSAYFFHEKSQMPVHNPK